MYGFFRLVCSFDIFLFIELGYISSRIVCGPLPSNAVCWYVFVGGRFRFFPGVLVEFEGGWCCVWLIGVSACDSDPVLCGLEVALQARGLFGN